MAHKYLGATIDLHGGGTDLIFPHHENEIAQSEAANGAEFARYWLHCGLITVAHKKMSKSLGNFTTYRDAAALFPPEAIRFYFLSVHYRMPMEYGVHLLAQAQKGLERIQNARESLAYIIRILREHPAENPTHSIDVAPFHQQFIAAMDDDFNTADAIAALFDMTRYLNSQTGTHTPRQYHLHEIEAAAQLMDTLGDVLGFTLYKSPHSDAEVEALVAQRQEARANKNYAEADAIRIRLGEMGVVLFDTASGARWSRG
jgi:cysteinyl-tRNA synthetase